MRVVCFFFQAEDGIRDVAVTGVQTCALPILFGFPGFVRVFHPGPPSLFGNAQSSLFCVRAGSSPVPHVGVKGTPSLTVRIRPSSQRSEEHTSELQSRLHLVCRLLLEKKKKYTCTATSHSTRYDPARSSAR